MFLLLPIGDDNPKERTPYVNYAILAVNLLFFLIAGPEPSWKAIDILALHPAEFSVVQLFTSMFLHAGWLHLIGNMLFLWIFGDNVEDRLGHVGYALLYLAWGVLAAFGHMATTSQPELPMMGASGAISGVIGAYVVFHPNRPIKMFLWFILYVRVFLVRAVFWIGFWFLQQLVLAAVDESGGVAYAAHIGGFAAGALVGAIVHYVVSPMPKGASVPPGLARASRVPIGSGSAPRPAPAIPDMVFSDDPDRTYAVLGTGDVATVAPDTVQMVAAATGEAPQDVLHRVRSTRGVIARNIDLPTAELVTRGMKEARHEVITVPDVADNRPPIPLTATAIAWSAGGIGVTFGSRGLQVPWSSPTLVAAAKIDGVPVVDLFAPEVGRARIAGDIPAGEVDPRTGQLVASTLDRLAQAVLRHREAAWLNEGVRVLANHGQWGWLAFPSEAEYEDYLFWIHNLIRHQRRGALR